MECKSGRCHVLCLISYNAIFWQQKQTKKKAEKGGLSSEAYFLNMLNYQVFSHIKRQLKKMKAIMLNSLLPLLNVICHLHFKTAFPHPPAPTPPTLVSATSLPQWDKMLCQQRRYSWHQVSKIPRIKAAIIHNTCLSRHHSAQSFYTAIRLTLYITCGESAGRKSIARLWEGTLNQQPLSVREQSQKASLGRLKHSERLPSVSGIQVFEEAIPRTSDRCDSLDRFLAKIN